MQILHFYLGYFDVCTTFVSKMRQFRTIIIILISVCTLEFAQAEVITSFFNCHSFHLKHAQNIPDGTDDISSISIEHGELVLLEGINCLSLKAPETSCKTLVLYENEYNFQIIYSYWRPPKLCVNNI